MHNTSVPCSAHRDRSLLFLWRCGAVKGCWFFHGSPFTLRLTMVILRGLGGRLQGGLRRRCAVESRCFSFRPVGHPSGVRERPSSRRPLEVGGRRATRPGGYVGHSEPVAGWPASQLVVACRAEGGRSVGSWSCLRVGGAVSGCIEGFSARRS